MSSCLQISSNSFHGFHYLNIDIEKGMMVWGKTIYEKIWFWTRLQFLTKFWYEMIFIGQIHNVHRLYKINVKQYESG